MCSVTLRVELYDEADGADARLNIEAAALASVRKVTEQIRTGGVISALDSLQRKFRNEAALGGSRPYFVLANVAPKEWSIEYNTFRRADEFECTLDAAVLPVPPSAIRSITAFVAIEQVASSDWKRGIEDDIGGFGTASATLPQLRPDFSNCDFAGIGSEPEQTIQGDGVPTVKIKFVDFLGLLANAKPKAGHELNEALPISKAIDEFLRGSTAEGLEVVWVDDEDEPNFGKYKPKTKKKKGKAGAAASAKQSAHGQQTYLDAIVQACANVGCVPRLNVMRLELGFAGTVYEGRDRSASKATKATILVGNVVEGFTVKHQLVGVKTQSVQVVSYDPDRHIQYAARWPPDPKSVKPVTIDPGKPPVLPPLAANIGLPGYEQLDDSVLLIPVAPTSNPELLPKLAEAYFLERTRQKVKYTVTTHSPTSDPFAVEPPSGDLLALRAGDHVTFGLVKENGDPDRLALVPPVVRVLAGAVGAGGIGSLLQAAGVPRAAAQSMAAAIARMPVTDRLVVDTLKISGGHDKAAELELTLSALTVIVSDLQAKASGEDPDDVVNGIIEQGPVLRALDLETLQKRFAEARSRIRNSGAPDDVVDAKLKQIDTLEKGAMKGR